MIIPVILAGGSGTRLWPLSRKLYPKQLLKLTNQYTMLQNTLLRLKDAADMAEPIVICNVQHRYLVSEQLADMGIRPAALYLEPMGKNTAPAVAVAAVKARSIDPQALIMILPADHLIRDTRKFHDAIQAAAAEAEKGALITFGVVPDRPETGYGYIRKGPPLSAANEKESKADSGAAAYAIDEFVEKPDLETARQYLASGEYCWNSGMFMFGAASVLDEMHRFVPEIADAAGASLQNARPAENPDPESEGAVWLLDAGAFGGCPSDSIDYAVMEKTERGGMIPFDAGWDDLGSWAAIWDVGEKDADGNILAGDVMTNDVQNSLIFSTKRLVAGVGLSNQVVVETPDAVLVADMARAQSVKHIVDRLKTENRKEANAHTRMLLSWGEIEVIDPAAEMHIRKIRLSPGAQLVFDGHSHAHLAWMIVSGSGRIGMDEERTEVLPGSLFPFAPDAGVRLFNSGSEPLVVLEMIRQMNPAADHLEVFPPGRSPGPSAANNF